MLTLMRVIRARIDLQLLPHMPSKGVLGEHSPDGQLDHSIRMPFDHAPERDVLLTAHISRVPEVGFLVSLVSGQRDLLGIDHHDVITHIEMGRKHRLVFAANDGLTVSCFVDDKFTTTLVTATKKRGGN